MQPVLHILPHTHWDREWFVPSGFTREWLVPFFDALFDRFDSHPDYRFTLDGQSILIEDYLSLLGRRRGEEALSRIEALVREGRLTVGPYYQQPDWQLVSGEALVRNLLIGIDDTRVLGADRFVGWLMDNFGQIAQCVQIHREFGADGLFAWRGFDLLPAAMRSELRWESPDGSALPVAYLLDSYRNGMRLFSRPEILLRRLAEARERVRPFSTDEHLLLMNGYDQEMDPESPGEIPPGTTVRLTSPTEYLDAKRGIHDRSLPPVRGSQYSGRFISVFPGILSARNYLKVANDYAQAMQERYLEPLTTILSVSNSDASPVIEELRDELNLVWRLILQNHPHDTICGVSSDPIHEEAELRLAEIADRQNRTLDRLLQSLGIRPLGETQSGAPGAGETYAVFNPSLHARRAMLDGVWSESIAPLSLSIVRRRNDTPDSPRVTARTTDGPVELSNESVHAAVYADGTIVVGGRKTADSSGRDGSTVRVTWRDTGDCGDTYNFDVPPRDAPNRVSIVDGTITWTSRTPDRVSFELSGVFRLPRELTEDRQTRTETVVDNTVTLRIELRSTEPFLRAAVVVDNLSRDHRLQMVVSVADEGGDGTATGPSDSMGMRVLNQFVWEDPAEHRASLAPYRDEELPQSARRLMLGAREPEPPRFVPNDRAFAVGSRSAAALVAHRGLHELEPLEDGSVAATIVRAVGWLARGDLSSRTGDAGPEIFTPDAQCRRRIAIPFFVSPLPSLRASEGADAAKIVEAALHPLPILGVPDTDDPSVGIAAALPPDLIPDISTDGNASSAVLSALKIREDGKGPIMRLFNPGRDAVTVRWNAPVTAFDLAEHPRTPDERARSMHEIPSGRIYTVALSTPAGDTPRRSLRAVPAADRFSAALDAAIPYRRFDVEPYYLSAHRRSVFADDCAVGLPEPANEPDLAYLRSTLAVEEARLGRLRSELAEAERALEAIRPERRDALERDTVAVVSRISTVTRQILEAELSILFTRRLCDGGTREALYQRIEEIALKLNHARVAKRADDYLVALTADS